MTCCNWTFQTKVMANWTWTNHNHGWMLIYDTNTTNFEGKNFWFKCAMWMSSLQGIYKCLTCCNWTYQTKVMGIELEQITSKPICIDVNLRYEHDKTFTEKQFDLRVSCEWAHYKLHTNAWLVVIGPSKPKLWLIELEQITTKSTCMDVNLWFEHDKLWGEKHFWFKSAMWMSSLQAT